MPGLVWWSGGQAAILGAAKLTLCSTRRDVSHSHPAVTLTHRSFSAKGAGSRSTTKHRNNFYTTREAAKLMQLLSSPLLLPDPENYRAVLREAGLMLAPYPPVGFNTHQTLSSEGLQDCGESESALYLSYSIMPPGKREGLFCQVQTCPLCMLTRRSIPQMSGALPYNLLLPHR